MINLSILNHKLIEQKDTYWLNGTNYLCLKCKATVVFFKTEYSEAYAMEIRGRDTIIMMSCEDYIIKNIIE